MKHVLVISLVMLLSLVVKGQTTQKERKVVQVMTPQSFYLNGRTRAALGGKSTATFNIVLPENTVEWFYSFTTSKGTKPKSNIGLLSQLTRFYDPTGISALATNAVLTPSGVGVCDVFVMDRDNCTKFMNTFDQLRGAFTYARDHSRENYKDGTVHVRDITSRELCLAFRNPSASEGTSITFEVAAVVEEETIVKKSQQEIEGETFAKLARSAYEKEEYDRSLELNKKAVELNPNQERVYKDIGLVYLIKNDYISAISNYATAITLFKKSKDPVYWFNMAIYDLNGLLTKHGKVDGAEDILEMLKKEAPK